MGRGKRSVLALFGFKKQRQEEEEGAEDGRQRYYHQGTRVRPSDDDDYRRQWYAERDINRRASEFIERVHRGLRANGEDG